MRAAVAAAVLAVRVRAGVPSLIASGPTLEPPFYVRTSTDKACAAFCASHATAGGGAVFVQHLRKAGGTMVRSYLANYRCDASAGRHRRAARARTSRVIVQESLAFNPYSLRAEPRAVFVTCLRDPVARIESLYFFEGRWTQKDFRRTNETALNVSAWTAKVASASTRRAAAAASAFARDGAWPLRVRLWEEVADYYVQIFSGVPARPVGAAHYAVSRKPLQLRFNMTLYESMRAIFVSRSRELVQR